MMRCVAGLLAEDGAADVVEAAEAVDIAAKVWDAQQRGGAGELVLELVDALAVEVGQHLEVGRVLAQLGGQVAALLGGEVGGEGVGEVVGEEGRGAV
jgi:hypothetical protein